MWVGRAAAHAQGRESSDSLARRARVSSGVAWRGRGERRLLDSPCSTCLCPSDFKTRDAPKERESRWSTVQEVLLTSLAGWKGGYRELRGWAYGLAFSLGLRDRTTEVFGCAPAHWNVERVNQPTTHPIRASSAPASARGVRAPGPSSCDDLHPDPHPPNSTTTSLSRAEGLDLIVCVSLKPRAVETTDICTQLSSRFHSLAAKRILMFP